jgi:DNA-binding transcriptional LysR family regulator
MQLLDLNLITALDALLAERSVTKAAGRLGLSASAMSRTLSRLRTVTGDKLLVQAGRMLVPTPYAEEIAERVHALARDARAVLQPSGASLDLARLERTFVIRANDGFIERMGAPLMAALGQAAPHVRLHFVPKPDKDAQPLRDGIIDLEIGVLGTRAPELRTRLLFRDRFVGICRSSHPVLAKRGVTAKRYASCRHVVVSRKREFLGPVDDALGKTGLNRTIVMVVPTYADAMRIARHTDLVGLIPHSCLDEASRGDDDGGAGLRHFDLPVRTPAIEVSAIWHPRVHADPAHRWLRQTVLTVCQNERRSDRSAFSPDG